MPRVETSVVISSDVDKVMNLAKNVESFPEFMEDVKSVKIIEKSPDGNSFTTEFVGIVKEFKTTMKWVESDVWDFDARTCKFDLVKGDFKSYTGLWTFEAVDGGTKFTSVIDFEYDIPMIGPLIKSLIAKKMKQNVENMLSAIKGKLES